MIDSDAAPHADTYPLFATAPRGVEGLLLDELRLLGATDLKETLGGVAARGTLETAYRLCLWSRLASRVLLPLARFPIPDADALYEAAKAIDWPHHFDPSRTFAVESAGQSKTVTHSHYASLRVKDAVVDRFRAAGLARPNVDADAPHLRIHLHLDGDHAQISLDLVGEALHRRGYRPRQVQAPLKENLAAALLLRAGWPAIAAQGGALLDPFCGSGTFAIEAGWIAGDHAPGLLRQDWGFAHWNEHQPRIWRQLREEAENRAVEGFKNIPPLVGSDIDERAIRIARDNGKRAGLTGKVDFRLGDATQVETVGSGTGLVIANPPYGERLSDEAELVKLHSLYGSRLKAALPGWRAAVFTGRPDLGLRLGLKADKLYAFYNGALPCKLLLMDIRAAAPAAVVAAGETTGEVSGATAKPETRRSPAPDFENRLRKNLTHLNKWAKRAGVSNFRLYDADLPDYAVAVDLYRTDALHVVVQEYAPPKTIDPAVAERRLRNAFAVIADVLQLPSAQLHYKLRKAQRGKDQYQRQGEHARYHVVEEAGCKLWVNFDDYLDTGLFLDHRPLRERIQKEAAGKRVLNLFCYTGSASIHAAQGGAAHTVSVDMSNTYLDWLGQNFELNGMASEWLDARHPLPARLPRNTILRADCVEWLATTAADAAAPKFDLIFCDPPTFSNSKKMEDSWDIQRDHRALIHNAARLLAPGGVLYFSTNRQRFKLEAPETLHVVDITAQTLGEDFKRPPPPHRAWRITRG